MKTKETKEKIKKNWLIVDSWSRVVLEWFDYGDGKKAKDVLKNCYPNDLLMRAAYIEEEDGTTSPWAVGYTFADAVENAKQGYFDNY